MVAPAAPAEAPPRALVTSSRPPLRSGAELPIRIDVVKRSPVLSACLGVFAAWIVCPPLHANTGDPPQWPVPAAADESESESESAPVAPPADAPADPPPAAAEPEGAGVVRAVFARSIVNREPVDVVSALEREAGSVLFFSELRGLEGQTVVHEWIYRDEVVTRVPIQVGAPRWRAHSRKTLHPDWTGTWTVVVRAASGRELHRSELRYGATP